MNLADGDRHGYAVIKEVAERTRGAERLGAGTLCAILKRLLEDGLIANVGPPAPADDRWHRCYRLTPLGRRVAKAEFDRLERAVTTARSSHLSGRLRPA